MAVHNGERFLPAALKSLLGQTHRNFELLIMNDGSTDSSVDIIQSVQDERIRLFSQKRSGLTVSLNRLIAHATGEYIARADADDIYLPGRLECQIRFLCECQDVGVVGAFYQEIDEDDNTIATGWLPVAHTEIVRYFRVGSSIMHPIVMFRKAVFDRVGGYDNSLRYAQDYELWTRLSTVTRFANIPKVLLQYRCHGHAVSRKNRWHQVEAHRRIRAVYWDRIKPEAANTSKWRSEIQSTLREEWKILQQCNLELPEIKKKIAQSRICEANLAFGAKRVDIGVQCLFEISLMYYRLPLHIVFVFSKIFGFYPVWNIIRRLTTCKLNRIVKDNPIFEW